MCVCVCVCVRASVCVCVCVCMYCFRTNWGGELIELASYGSWLLGKKYV